MMNANRWQSHDERVRAEGVGLTANNRDLVSLNKNNSISIMTMCGLWHCMPLCGCFL